MAHSVADDMRPQLKDTLDELKERVAHVEGAELEDNYMSVSVHYRAVRVPWAPSAVACDVARRGPHAPLTWRFVMRTRVCTGGTWQGEGCGRRN